MVYHFYLLSNTKFSNTKFSYICGYFPGLFILFHQSVYLSLQIPYFFNCRFIIIQQLVGYYHSSFTSPSIQNCLSCFSLLYFHTKLRITFITTLLGFWLYWNYRVSCQPKEVLSLMFQNRISLDPIWIMWTLPTNDCGWGMGWSDGQVWSCAPLGVVKGISQPHLNHSQERWEENYFPQQDWGHYQKETQVLNLQNQLLSLQKPTDLFSF